MARLTLLFLGPFRVTLDDRPVNEFPTHKVRALLAYLAVESHRPHPRESLAGLLWPDFPESSARQSLSQALFSLRRAIGDDAAGPPYLFVARDTLQFNPESDHWLDLAALDADLSALPGLPVSQTIARLQEAVALYGGEFLEGFSLGDSAPFEEWTTRKREELHRRVLAALLRLAELYEQEGDYESAQRYARRQVDLEPSDEAAHRQLMRALALGGQRNAALAQYESCRRLLADELDVEPAPETTALYERIRRGALVAARPATAPPSPPPVQLPAPDLPDLLRPLFVAREEELGQLGRWLEEALCGQGRVGLVVGEPGSGKTMLLQEFARRAMEARPDLVVAAGDCNAYTGVGDPYLPFAEILQMLSGDVEARRAAGALTVLHVRCLRTAFPQVLQALLEGGPALVDFLIPGAALLARARSLGSLDTSLQAQLQELVQRKAAGAGPTIVSPTDLFQQVTRVLQALARERPLLLLLDDLQWADAGSLSLLFHLRRRLAGSRILVLGAYRAEEVASGRDGAPHPLQPVVHEFRRLWGDIHLDLAHAAGRRFVDALLDSEPNGLQTAFREALYRHTGGHALFTVELLRGLQQRGDLVRDRDGCWVEGETLDWEDLPARVEAVIAAHIGRLPKPWQDLLAVASVEGEEFTAEVLARVQGGGEREIIRLLSVPLGREHRLVVATNLQCRRGQRLSRYRFRHVLFQRYLYQRLDNVERAHLHGEVGLALEAVYGTTPWDPLSQTRTYQDLMPSNLEANNPQRLEMLADAPQLARHFAAAGMADKALGYLTQAALRADWLLAVTEMDAYLSAGLALLPEVPDGLRRSAYEFSLQLLRGRMVATNKGWLAPEVGQAWERAYELAQGMGGIPLLWLALKILADYYRQCGRLRQARQCGERAVELAQGQDPLARVVSQANLAQTLLLSGDLVLAARHLEPLYAPWLGPQPHPASFAFEDHCNYLAHAAWLLWCLGYPDRALRVSQATLATAHAAETAYDIVQALCDAVCFLHQLRREGAPTQDALQELSSFVGDVGFLLVMRPFATLFQGWVHAQSGAVDQGIVELRQGLADWSAMFVVLRPYWRGLLAEALAQAGQVDEGLSTLAEAVEQAESTGEGFSLAELYRLKGELLLQHGVPEAEAEACFQKAIAVARAQEARSWELRATTSLARLWQRQGKCQEARAALAAIYGWFTEGFDTPDLQEARALLEQSSCGTQKPPMICSSVSE